MDIITELLSENIVSQFKRYSSQKSKDCSSQFEKGGRFDMGLVTPPRKKRAYYRNHKRPVAAQQLEEQGSKLS